MSPSERKSHPPVACELGALTEDERAERAVLFRSMRESVRAVDELPDGYRVHLDPDATSHELLERLLALEARCCAFLDTRVGNGDSGVVLDLVGPEGTKQFLRAEFGFGEEP